MEAELKTATSSTQQRPRGAGTEPELGDLKKPEVLQAKHPSEQKRELRRIDGSNSDDWNNRIANETINTLWLKHLDDETRHRQMAAQLIASHSAAMECYRCA